MLFIVFHTKMNGFALENTDFSFKNAIFHVILIWNFQLFPKFRGPARPGSLDFQNFSRSGPAHGPGRAGPQGRAGNFDPYLRGFF